VGSCMVLVGLATIQRSRRCLGSFLGRARCGAPPPCTACVFVVRRVAMSSQVGAPVADLKSHPTTEHSNCVGGAMMVF
jgi:hypothetical protein